METESNGSLTSDALDISEPYGQEKSVMIVKNLTTRQKKMDL